jgi:hypothetical protein
LGLKMADPGEASIFTPLERTQSPIAVKSVRIDRWFLLYKPVCSVRFGPIRKQKEIEITIRFQILSAKSISLES